MIRLSAANVAIIILIAALGLIALKALARTGFANLPVVGGAAKLLAAA